MIRFGDELRQQREARGWSVEDMCAVTKVSPQNVRLLEAGEYRQLPGGVFRKGMVRSYVGALGMDEVEWVERFELSLREAGLASEGDGDWVQFAENVRKNRGRDRRGMGLRWLGVLLMLGALGGLGWAAWHYVVRPKMVSQGHVTPGGG